MEIESLTRIDWTGHWNRLQPCLIQSCTLLLSDRNPTGQHGKAEKAFGDRQTVTLNFQQLWQRMNSLVFGMPPEPFVFHFLPGSYAAKVQAGPFRPRAPGGENSREGGSS